MIRDSRQHPGMLSCQPGALPVTDLRLFCQCLGIPPVFLLGLEGGHTAPLSFPFALPARLPGNLCSQPRCQDSRPFSVPPGAPPSGPTRAEYLGNSAGHVCSKGTLRQCWGRKLDWGAFTSIHSAPPPPTRHPGLQQTELRRDRMTVQCAGKEGKRR